MSKPSKFVWHDVMTTAMKAAEVFYANVVGWRMQDAGMPDGGYTLLMDGEKMAGGLMPIPDDARAMGVPPAWMGYIGVENADAKAKEIVDAGGKIHRPPQDIPGVGRFAVAADPFGAGFMIFQGNGEPDAGPVPFMTPKHIGWNELHGGDLEASFAFYAKLFGWTKGEAHDMGGMIYQTFHTGDGHATGGMMKAMEGVPPHWAYYISVADFDAAVDRAVAGGGKKLMEPMQVPGEAWICPLQDPQGAHFSLIGMR
ncbi:MAG: VOC family protein [Beijerinckiaceae bacterium]